MTIGKTVRASWARPARFTLRELMVLIACEPDPVERRRCLELVYGWYYDRSRNGRRFLAASILAILGIAAASDRLPDDRVALTVWLLLGFLAYAARGRVLLAPLHREYLLCLTLLRRLQDFGTALTAAYDAGRCGEPRVYWGRAYLIGGGEDEHIRPPDDVGAPAWDSVTDPGRSRWNVRMGEYLFDVLGPVPTDGYERSQRFVSRSTRVCGAHPA